MTHDRDWERVVRWLLGLAERQVTVAGSRATFVSDMYFEAAECIERLAKENGQMFAHINRTEQLLDSLQAAESVYRKSHDIHGDGHMVTGRAWDKMRKRGDEAREFLDKERGGEPAGGGDE